MQCKRYLQKLQLYAVQIKSNFTRSSMLKRTVELMKSGSRGKDGSHPLDPSTRQERIEEGEEIM